MAQENSSDDPFQDTLIGSKSLFYDISAKHLYFQKGSVPLSSARNVVQFAITGLSFHFSVGLYLFIDFSCSMGSEQCERCNYGV